MPLQILFIAANPPSSSDLPELDWESETDWLGGTSHQIVYLLGDVTLSRLLQATAGRRFDIVHIAAHGGESGVMLTEGEYPPESLLRLVKSVRARLVFLNACHTPFLAQFLIDRGVPNVVAYTKPILDHEAISVAVYFYRELEDLSRVKEVVDRVSSGDGVLSFLSREESGEEKIEVFSDGIVEKELQALRQLIERNYQLGRAWDVMIMFAIALVIFYLLFFLR